MAYACVALRCVRQQIEKGRRTSGKVPMRGSTGIFLALLSRLDDERSYIKFRVRVDGPRVLGSKYKDTGSTE